MGRVMPGALLVHNFQVITDRDRIFRRISMKSFDPMESVILESDPPIVRADHYAGTEEIQGNRLKEKELAPGRFRFDVSLQEPAILLVTENYSKGWKALPIGESVQDKYSIMPANYTQIAIPLKAGIHHIMMSYMPDSFIAGRYISSVSVVLFAAAVLFILIKSYGGTNSKSHAGTSSSAVRKP